MRRGGDATNYTELVHHVLRDARRALTMDEILTGVRSVEPIHAANPRALVQAIVDQSTMVLPVGEGRYGYLPYLLSSNSFRILLPAPLESPPFVELDPDALTALWPGRAPPERHGAARPALLELLNAGEAQLRRQFRLPGHWGFVASGELWQWLTELAASPGDSLLLHVQDADAGRYRASLERRSERDDVTVTLRNTQVADLAAAVVCQQGGEVRTEELAARLIAAGAYHDPVPPDPLLEVLAHDGRFVDAGLGVVALLDTWSEQDEQLAERRQQAMQQILGEVRPRFCRKPPTGPSSGERAEFARLMLEDRLDEAVSWLQRRNRIRSAPDGAVDVDLKGLLDDTQSVDDA